MAYPVPTLAALAEFKGVDEDDLTSWAPQALQQAAFVFGQATGLEEQPEGNDGTLALWGVLDFAFALLVQHEHADVLASPFSSETLGSYSYTLRQNAAQLALDGQATGVPWFDLAVSKLTGSSGVSSDAITVFEETGVVTTGSRRRVVSPARSRWAGASDPNDAAFYGWWRSS